MVREIKGLISAWGDEFTCEAADYDEKRDLLVLVMQPVERSGQVSFCSFKMASIAAEFDHVWNACQEYDHKERNDQTQFPVS